MFKLKQATYYTYDEFVAMLEYDDHMHMKFHGKTVELESEADGHYSIEGTRDQRGLLTRGSHIAVEGGSVWIPRIRRNVSEFAKFKVSFVVDENKPKDAEPGVPSHRENLALEYIFSMETKGSMPLIHVPSLDRVSNFFDSYQLRMIFDPHKELICGHVTDVSLMKSGVLNATVTLDCTYARRILIVDDTIIYFAPNGTRILDLSMGWLFNAGDHPVSMTGLRMNEIPFEGVPEADYFGIGEKSES